jgi:hypothetical protein
VRQSASSALTKLNESQPGDGLRVRMPPFIFRCPNTGFHVQGFAQDDDLSEGADDDVFVGVTCLVCGSVHFVNPKTGKTAGDSGE